MLHGVEFPYNLGTKSLVRALLQGSSPRHFGSQPRASRPLARAGVWPLTSEVRVARPKIRRSPASGLRGFAGYEER